MKRRSRFCRGRRCTVQQQLCAGNNYTRFERRLAGGAFLLLLLLSPLQASGINRPGLFQSKVYSTRVEVRPLEGLCTFDRPPLFAAELCSGGSMSPSAPAAAPAACFRIPRSLIPPGSETATRGKDSRHSTKYYRKRYGRPCGLRNKRAKYCLPFSRPSYVDGRAALPIPKCSSLNCFLCPSKPSSHVYMTCTVSWLWTFLSHHCVPSSSLQDSFIGLVVGHLLLTFLSKLHPQYAAARRVNRGSRPLISFLQYPYTGLPFLCIPATYRSQFCSEMGSQVQHGTLTHVFSDRARRRPELGLHRSSPLQRSGPPAGFCRRGNIAAGIRFRQPCNFSRSRLCAKSEGRQHRSRDIAIHEVGCCCVSRCPCGYSAIVVKNHLPPAANNVVGNNIPVLLQYHQGPPNDERVAETKHLNCSAVKGSVEHLQDDWKDVAALQDADQREQEAFERVASQVESELHIKTDAFTTAAQNLLQRQNVLQHNFHPRRGLQQRDQHGRQTNSSFSPADPHHVGLTDGNSEQHQHVYVDSGPLFNEQQVTETTDQQVPRLGASSAQKRDIYPGSLRALQTPCSLRASVPASPVAPQALMTDQNDREQARKPSYASVPSTRLPEFHVRKNEDCRSGMPTDYGLSSPPAPSLVVERQAVARGRQTPVHAALVNDGLERNERRKEFNKKQGQDNFLQQKHLQSEHGQQRQRERGAAAFPKGKKRHNSTAAAQNNTEIPWTAVHSTRPQQLDGGTSGDYETAAGAGDEGKRRDRRLIHLLLQSNSVPDVWRLLLHRNIQLLSGAGLVGVVQRLACLCASPHHQAVQQQFEGTSRTLAGRTNVSANDVDSRSRRSQRNTFSSHSTAEAQMYMQLQIRAEVKRHPIFKDIMNALPAKIDTLRASEAAALLHALATLRIRSAPELLDRTGAVIAAKAFGTDSLEKNVSAESAAISEPLRDVALGRLWTSIEMFPTLQHHPLLEALISYTIKRLRSAPEQRSGGRGGASAETAKDYYDSGMASLQKDCTDIREQDISKTAEHPLKEQSISTITAAVIAKAAVQMHLGSRYPNFIATLQFYILRLLFCKDSAAPGRPFRTPEKLDLKRARRDSTEGEIGRLILSLANLKKQQEQLNEVRDTLPSQISPFTLATGKSDEQVACPSAQRRRSMKSYAAANESHRHSEMPFTGSRAPPSDAAERTTTIEEENEQEEEDVVFLQTLGGFYSTRIATLDGRIHEQLPRLLKGLSYFYLSMLRKLQLKLSSKAGDEILRCVKLRSSMASLPELLVAAAVIVKQNEDSFDKLVVLVDLLIDLNSLLRTSKAFRKMLGRFGTTHVATSATGDTKGKKMVLNQGEAAADLERKIRENEWRRGEEFVQSVLKGLASRLQGHFERLLEKLRREKMARATNGGADYEEASVASQHMALLEKSQELLSALLDVKCTLTGDIFVECVRVLVGLTCRIQPPAGLHSEEQLPKNGVEEYFGDGGKQAATTAVDNSNDKSSRGSQGNALDGSSSSKEDAHFGSVSLVSPTMVPPPKQSAEEERLYWRQQLLDGSLLLRVNALYANRSIRRAIHAAHTADELLSAVTAAVKLRGPATSRLQIYTATAAGTPAAEPTVSSSGQAFRAAMKASSVHSDAGALAACLDDLSVTSALHRLAVLQQRHHGNPLHFDTEKDRPLVKATKASRRSILCDPRMHLLLQTVSLKIPTMGHQVTRVMWALEKLQYFDKRDTAGRDKRVQSERQKPSQQSELQGKSGQPDAAGNNGYQNSSVDHQAFSALRRNITLLLLKRTAAILRSDCLSGSELSATLRVLAGIDFAGITSEVGSPESDDTASRAQTEVDATLQDIRRSLVPSLQRSAKSLSGLDASIALYSLATLEWGAVPPRESPPLVTELGKDHHLKLSDGDGVDKNEALVEDRVRGPFIEEDKSNCLGNLDASWGARKDVETSSDKGSSSSLCSSRSTDSSSGIEGSSTYSTLLQRLTEELDNCNVQSSVVALWAVAVTAGRRQQVFERQNGEDVDDDRKEEQHEIPAAMWGLKDVEACALSPCTQDTQDATCASLKHVGEESLMYVKPLRLLPTEDAFLAAVRQKLEKHVAGMGRESLSMLLLAALMLRWRQPRLLLSAILRTLDILKMQSKAPTARKSYFAASGYEEGTKSERAAPFPFREYRNLEKRGEMHSRVWANLAVLQQQLLFPVTGEIENSEEKICFKNMQCNSKISEQEASFLGELWRAKRQAAAQLKEDLGEILSTTLCTSRPQHEWTIQQLQSLLLSWIIIEENRVLHQQQQQRQLLDNSQNLGHTANPLSSWVLGEDDGTQQAMQEVLTLLERFVSVRLVNTATQVGASITMGPQRHTRENISQEGSSEAENDAEVSFAADSPAAAPTNKKTKAGINSEVVLSGTGLTDHQSEELIKRLSLLLFALRRLRQLFSNSATAKENFFGETGFIPSVSDQVQPETLTSQRTCREQSQSDSPLTRSPLLPQCTSIDCFPPHRRTLLTVVAQVTTALLRTKRLRPSLPQLASLLLELRELVAEWAYWSEKTDETSQLCDASSITQTLGTSDHNDDSQKGPTQSPALGDTLKDLGESLADWMCVHLEEIDDKMHNVVLPLVQTLGAQTHLLRRLHLTALRPVKDSAEPHHISQSDVRASTFKQVENPSDSQRLLLRRSRAASLALQLHHRHRIAFRPPSILLSLLNSATEQVELLSPDRILPHDAAHALTTLQRWKMAFGRAATDDETEMPDMHVNDTVTVRQQKARSRVQQEYFSSSQLNPSGPAPGFTAAALQSVLRTRTELLLSVLSRPGKSNPLQVHGLNVTFNGVSDAHHQRVNRASGLPPDKPPPSTEKEEVVNRVDMHTIKSCERETMKRLSNSGLTQWDMLSLPQLVHASTATSQLLELPSAEPVWKRACITSETLHSDISETENARTSSGSAAAGGKRFINGGTRANRDAHMGGSSCHNEEVVAAAAAALTRRLLQPAFRRTTQKTDMTYSLQPPQLTQAYQKMDTRESSNSRNEADNRLPSGRTPLYGNTHRVPDEAPLDETPPVESPVAQSIHTVSDQPNPDQNGGGDCGGRTALRRSLILTASPRHWRRFRMFVRARRDWLAAAGALRLLGGGRNQRDVAQTLVGIASEISDMLEEHGSRPIETANIQQRQEETGTSYLKTYSGEGNLELVDIEKQLPIDDFIMDDDMLYPGEDQAADGSNTTIPAKKASQGNRATSVDQYQLILLQQLACYSFEEISYQLKALHAKGVLYRRKVDSTEKAADEHTKHALSVTGARILAALSSAPVLPVSVAAFVLQPSFAILGIVGDQQTALSNSFQGLVHTEGSSISEAYTNYITTLLRRLLPVVPQWLPRLNAHRAAALFLEISENLESVHFDEPRQVAQGENLPASGLESEGLEKTEHSKTTSTDGERSSENADRRFPGKRFMHISRERGRLHTLLLDFQRTIVLHARRSPGWMARFWKALMFQAKALSCKGGKQVIYSESEGISQQATADSAAAAFATNRWRKNHPSLDRISGTSALVRGDQKLDERMARYQIVCTEVVHLLNEIIGSSVRASDRDNGGMDSDSYRCPAGSQSAAISQSIESHQVNNRPSQKPQRLPSCSADFQRTETADWIYGAVAAAGSGLLDDSTQQRMATAAADISSGTAAYYSMLSFLANSRGAPPEATAYLVKMLATAAQDHLSAIRSTETSRTSLGGFQVRGEAGKQERERLILQEGGKTADGDSAGEDSEKKVTREASADEKKSKSTRFVRLAKAAWLVWVGTSLQQPRQERQSTLQTGRRGTTDLLKSYDEQENRFLKEAKQELGNTADIISGLLREEVLRLTMKAAELNRLEDDVASLPEDVYSLLTLSLDTAIKLYIEDGKGEVASRRLPRIEAILSDLTLLIDAATKKTLQTPLKLNDSRRKISVPLSFPSLPSLAYVLHLARQARVYHGPLLEAIAHSIHWHRHNASLKEEGTRAWYETSKTPRIHLKEAAHRGASSRRDKDCCSAPVGGGGKLDLWPSLLLLADAATYQPQEGLRSLRRELLLLLEPLVQTAPLNHLVRILRFSINAAPVSESLSFHVRKRRRSGNNATVNESATGILDAVNLPTRLQVTEERKARRIHDNIAYRCMTEGGSLLRSLRPNGKDCSKTFEDRLAELEELGYAPVGLIDTLNKVHLLHTLSQTRSGGATTAEKENQAVDYSQLPSHLQSASFLTLAKPEARKRVRATSRRNARVLVSSEDAEWWPQVLPVAVKHYVRKNSSRLHKDVSGVLSQTLHLAHENEVWTPTGLSLDIALHQRAADGNPVAVEVDGPTHYVTSVASSPAAERQCRESAGKHHCVTPSSSSRWPEIPTALTQFKRQLLEQTGWHVVNVPFFEWTTASRTHPPSRHSEAQKTADFGKQSLKQPEPSILDWEKDTEGDFSAEQLLPGALLAAKVRSLLLGPPLDTNMSEARGDL